MEKYGVVEGAVKTASADNSGDPIGDAAKCIRAAMETVDAAGRIVEGISKERPSEEEVKKEK